jgi:hypothetical protein
MSSTPRKRLQTQTQTQTRPSNNVNNTANTPN